MLRDPFEELKKFETAMNRLFSDFWRDRPALLGSTSEVSPYAGANEVWKPLTDISTSDNEYKLKVDLPGVKKEDIKINVDENKVDISAEVKTEVKEEKDGYLRRERSYSSYSRTFALPEKIDPKKVKAKYEDGVLTLDLPKMEEKTKTLVKIN